MEQFFGTKIVNAIPMDRQTYNDFRGWELPADENGSDAGMLIESLNGVKNTDTYDGYVQWLTAEEFNRTYRPSGSMSFGEAVAAMKAGKKVARSGWNGKGMYIALMAGYPEGVTANAMTRQVHNLPESTVVTVNPYIVMKTAADELQAGWLASQTDMLSEDWGIV